MEICGNEPCPHWHVGKWSECPSYCENRNSSATTTKPRRHRQVTCKLRGEQLDNSVCKQLARTHQPHSIEDCPTQTECAEWITDEWSDCSVKCGPGGVQTRRVACQFVELSSKKNDLYQSIAAKNARLGLTVIADDSKCNQYTRPANLSECIVQERCPQWRFTQWSSCSGNCSTGVGFRTRSVFCENRDEEMECDELTKPISRESCSKACVGEWTTEDWSDVRTFLFKN
jgi:hypothetical protein